MIMFSSNKPKSIQLVILKNNFKFMYKDCIKGFNDTQITPPRSSNPEFFAKIPYSTQQPSLQIGHYLRFNDKFYFKSIIS